MCRLWHDSKICRMTEATLPYNDYGRMMRQRFGGRVQKLSIDAAMVCPNRDARGGRGGCTFCLNEAFSPSYCRGVKRLCEQIDEGLRFHLSRGRSADYYVAYLQAGTNTNASVDRLRKLYAEVLDHPRISGLIIGTRPDAVSSEKLDMLVDFSTKKYVAVEYGVESTSDATLSHVNRGHSFDDARWAIGATRERGIDVGAHFILGLPNESPEQLIEQTDKINELGINYIKFHQLQIFRSTPMAQEWALHPERFMFGAEGLSASSYVDLLVAILRRLAPTIYLDRLFALAPRHLTLHSPLGGLRPDTLKNMLVSRMYSGGFVQGDLYNY